AAAGFTLVVACAQSGAVVEAPPAPPSVAVVEEVQSTISMEITASVRISARDDTDSQALGEIVITPQIVVVDQREVVMLTADAFLIDGTPTIGVDLIWAMVDVRAGSINLDGLFTASHEAGEYAGAISVTAVQKTGDDFVNFTVSVPVTVVGEARKITFDEIVILPTEATVLVGQLYRFRAVAYDEHGLVIPGVSYEWSVNDQAIGELNSIGYLSVSAAAGKYINGVTVVGRWNGIEVTKSVVVTVLDVPDWDENLTVQVLPQRFQIDHGENMQLMAVAINGLGELVAGTELRWTMAEPVAGSVSGTGLFVAGPEPGVFTEAVKVEAIIPGENGVIHAVDFASVVVRGDREQRRLDTVVARPVAVKLDTGGRIILAARALDAQGRPADNVAVVWEVVTDGVGEVDQFGSFKASGKPGIYNSAVRAILTQSLNGELITRTATIDINITGTLTDVVVEPDVAAVIEGDTIHYSAVGLDENGLVISGLLVRWRLADPDLGTIDPLGNFTANARPGLHTDAIIATVIQTITD
ncbi:MAG: hypothetical protein IIB17_00420, partial [Chloroflexi bacterium]|nr:hypothetical protein [Chloroflexota bacterium]